MANNTPNRNASSSYFGWRFQIDSAIVLTLRYIRELSFVLVENNEDIEPELNDGGRIYAQAKARVRANDPGDGSLQRLKAGLKTLNDSFGRSDCRELIYVTNDPMPFGRHANDLLFGRHTFLGYDELSSKQQEAILCALHENGYAQDLVKKLSIYGIWYFGNDELTRCEEIDYRIRAFLDSAGLGASARPSEGRLRADWEQALGFSASVDCESIPAKTVSKEAFVWPVVVESCMKSTASCEDLGLDEDQQDELDSVYAKLIEAQSDRFDVVARVIADYSEYSKVSDGTQKKIRDGFIGAKWESYVSLLGADAIDDEEVRYAFVCLVLSKVIKKRDTIEKVKDAVGLQD